MSFIQTDPELISTTISLMRLFKMLKHVLSTIYLIKNESIMAKRLSKERNSIVLS